MKSSFLLALMFTMACISVVSANPVYVYVNGSNLKVGQVGSVDIVLDKTPTGLSQYGLALFLSTDSAKILDVSVPNWAIITEYVKTPSSLWLEAVDIRDGVKNESSDVTLATVKLEGVSKGDVLLILKVVYLIDDSGKALEYVEGSTSITVKSVSFPGYSQSNDLDGDGLYEDINGDGIFNFKDVFDFFKAFEAIPSENKRYYDFDKDGRISFGDAIMLFKML